jgi:hypothetical protein
MSDRIILSPEEAKQFEPTLVDIILRASDRELDPSMKPLIQKWNDPPKAIQILEVIDHCIYGSLASGFTINVFQIMYIQALKKEGTTHELLVDQATWRKQRN